MKAGWNVRPLGEVCKLLNGRAYNKEELLAEGPTPVLRVGNFFTNRNWYYSDLTLGEDKYCDDGDLLYAWSASFGPRIWQGGRVIYHYHIWKTQPDPNLLVKKFLFHFLDWDKENIKAAQGAGTTMIHVTKGAMEARLMPVPPLDEQRRIVAVLDKAFAGIATATANAQKNLTNARALFESYLQSILVKRGDGWVDRSIADIADTSLGKMLDKQKNKGELKPYLRNINVRWFEFDLKDLLQMRFEESEEDRYSIKKGDIVICEGGYPGRAAIWQSEESIYYQKALHRVRFKNALMGRWFVYILYYADSVGDLKMHFTGSGIQHFTGQALKKFSIPVPLSDDLPELISGLDLVFHKTNLAIATYERKISALTELKQSLLQKAFAGELT